MAEGARLESVYTGNRIEGSNPSLSAIVSIVEGHWTVHSPIKRNPGFDGRERSQRLPLSQAREGYARGPYFTGKDEGAHPSARTVAEIRHVTRGALAVRQVTEIQRQNV